jgi:hypothetical protein
VPELLTGTEPTQPSEPLPPLAVHDVAVVVAQVKEVDWPLVMTVGEAAKLVTAAGAGLTVTLAVPLALPPAPVHSNVKL